MYVCSVHVCVCVYVCVCACVCMCVHVCACLCVRWKSTCADVVAFDVSALTYLLTYLLVRERANDIPFARAGVVIQHVYVYTYARALSLSHVRCRHWTRGLRRGPRSAATRRFAPRGPQQTLHEKERQKEKGAR
jgi:hypothetical protein